MASLACNRPRFALAVDDLAAWSMYEARQRFFRAAIPPGLRSGTPTAYPWSASQSASVRLDALCRLSIGIRARLAPLSLLSEAAPKASERLNVSLDAHVIQDQKNRADRGPP